MEEHSEGGLQATFFLPHYRGPTLPVGRGSVVATIGPGLASGSAFSFCP
jgi:hypothetical protein